MTVTPDTIATALGVAAPSSGSATEKQWQMWIADAQLLIGSRLGDVSTLDGPTVDYVVREAVVAHARRPDSATQVTTSVDDGSTSRTYSSSAGRVSISDDLWALLDPDIADAGAFAVTPTFLPDWPVLP